MVPIDSSQDFVQKLRQTNSNVEYKVVASGDHYYAMIDEGIPAGIAWMEEQ